MFYTAGFTASIPAETTFSNKFSSSDSWKIKAAFSVVLAGDILFTFGLTLGGVIAFAFGQILLTIRTSSTFGTRSSILLLEV